MDISDYTAFAAEGRLGAAAAAAFAAGFRLADHELFDLVTGLQRGREPARLLPATRPGLGRLLGISIFWEYARILPAFARCASRVRSLRLAHLLLAPKLRQSLLKLTLFRRQSNRQDLTELLMERP